MSDLNHKDERIYKMYPRGWCRSRDLNPDTREGARP